MSIEHWWNDNDRSKLKYSEKNLSEQHSVHHKFHMDRLVNDNLRHGTALHSVKF